MLNGIQIALDQGERYQTINVYSHENNHEVLIDEIQGEFEYSVFCEDCYMQFCDLYHLAYVFKLYRKFFSVF